MTVGSNTVLYTGATGSLVDKSMTGSLVNTSMTGILINTSMTGTFITTSMTGGFGGGSTGTSLVDKSMTGILLNAASTGIFVNTSMTGTLINTAMTGIFVNTSMTGILANASSVASTGASFATWTGKNQSFTTNINPTGLDTYSISFPVSFSASPRVQCTLEVTGNYLYSLGVTARGTTGFTVLFSDTIMESGVTLHTYASLT